MRWGLVGGGRGSGRSLSLRHALIQRRNPPLQPINQFPLFRHSGVQLFNGRILMRDPDLKGVDARCVRGVGHGLSLGWIEQMRYPPCGDAAGIGLGSQVVPWVMTVFPNLIWDPARKNVGRNSAFLSSGSQLLLGSRVLGFRLLRAGGGPRTSPNSVKVELSLDPRLHGDVG